MKLFLIKHVLVFGLFNHLLIPVMYTPKTRRFIKGNPVDIYRLGILRKLGTVTNGFTIRERSCADDVSLSG